MLVAAWAFVPGVRAHRQWVVVALASVGIASLALAALVFEGHGIADAAFSIIGAGLMMAAHWKNRVLLAAQLHGAT